MNVRYALKSRVLAPSYAVKVGFFVPVLFFQYNCVMSFGQKAAEIIDQTFCFANLIDQIFYSKDTKYFYFQRYNISQNAELEYKAV